MIKDTDKTIGLACYRQRGDLTGRKLKEYLPTMLVINLSTLVLGSANGIVAGNLVSSNALSSVNLFFPVLVVVASVSTLTAVGIATSLSTAMGRNDVAAIDHIKGAALRIMLVMAIAAGILQIPVVWLVVRSYGLSEEMFRMTMQYAAGMMICTPLALISTVGTYELQITGRMKTLLVLAVIEGAANLLFDVLYTGVFHMGIAGIGYGTATANLIRCALTVGYLARRTDMFRSDTKKISAADVRTILSPGAPEAAYTLMTALQSYLIMKILLAAFGTDGGVIIGVCTLCLNLANLLLTGITASMRPLMGIYAGADHREGLRILMRQGMMLTIVCAGLATLAVGLRPEWFYAVNGVRSIPEGGIPSVRLYSLYFLPKGFDYLLRMYFSYRDDSKCATALTVAGNATLPLFAFLLWKAAPAPCIFLAYLATEAVVFVMAYVRYRGWLKKDRRELEEKGQDIVLYMTVKPDEAVEASRALRRFADENGISQRVSYRAALCMEEMVAYLQTAEIIHPAPGLEEGKPDAGQGPGVEVMVRFKGKNEAVFVELDEGRCIALDRNESSQKIITDNYGLLKKLAKSVEYQYILNMNYTRFTFDNGGK